MSQAPLVNYELHEFIRITRILGVRSDCKEILFVIFLFLHPLFSPQPLPLPLPQPQPSTLFNYSSLFFPCNF